MEAIAIATALRAAFADRPGTWHIRLRPSSDVVGDQSLSVTVVTPDSHTVTTSRCDPGNGSREQAVIELALRLADAIDRRR